MSQTAQSLCEKLLQRKAVLSCFLIVISKPLFVCKRLDSFFLFPFSCILKYAILEMMALVRILLVTKECAKTHFRFNGRKQMRVINIPKRKFVEWLACISLSFNGLTVTSLMQGCYFE